MSFDDIVLRLTENLKPVLMKMIPNEILRSTKRKFLNKDIAKLAKYKKEAFHPTAFKQGVNLIGDISADTGLGESCRTVAADLYNIQFPFSIYDFQLSATVSRSNQKWKNSISDILPYNINIIHINAHEMGISLKKIGYARLLDRRYNIAFWSWELEDFPREWIGCIEAVDEIWTPSEFTSSSIRKITTKPVNTIPHFILLDYDATYFNRAYFQLPEDKFLYLILYNSGSVEERKNPISAIKAYIEAFRGNEDGVGLVIKAGDIRKEELDHLKEMLSEMKHVFYITKNLTRIEIYSLIHEVDVYVSLHRAEGFGLVLAEAMMLNTPVIATGWSGNMEFMDESTACIVDYKLVQTKTSKAGFSKDSYWAEPSVQTATNYMKKLKEDTDYYKQIQKNAYEYVSTKLDPKQIGNRMKKRLLEIIKNNEV